MRYRLLVSGCIALLTLLGGCALSPQLVTVQPLVDVAAAPVGRGRMLGLEVVDTRAQPEFGTRGGVYATATVGPHNDVAAAVRRALAERLSAARFVVTPPQAAAPVGLRVEIIRIAYQTGGSPVVGEVRASAQVRAIVRNGAYTFTGDYTANSARQVVGPPGAAENEKIINEIVSQSLQHMLSDRKLLEALGR